MELLPMPPLPPLVLVGPLQQEDTQRETHTEILIPRWREGQQTTHPLSHCFLHLSLSPKTIGGREGLLSHGGPTPGGPSALCLAASWPARPEICPSWIQGSAYDKGLPWPRSNSSAFPQEPAREGKDKAVRSSPDVKLHIPQLRRQFSGAGGREGGGCLCG